MQLQQVAKGLEKLLAERAQRMHQGGWEQMGSWGWGQLWRTGGRSLGGATWPQSHWSRESEESEQQP